MIRWVAAGALALLGGCLHADVNRCGNGAICPSDQSCTETTALCGPTPQVDACLGASKVQFDHCSYATKDTMIDGTCHDNVCEPCGTSSNELAGCYTSSWVPMTSGVASDLASVWVASPHEAYAIGKAGTALRYDGVSWTHLTELEAMVTTGFVAMWGVAEDATGPQELFLLSDAGDVYHRAAGSWTKVHINSVRTMGTLGGVDRHNVFAGAIQGEIWRYDGTMWSESAPPNAAMPFLSCDAGCSPFWGTGPTNVYAAGHDGGETMGYVRHFDGTSWTTELTVSNNALFSAWGSGPDDVYAAGRPDSAQPLAHRDASGWMRTSDRVGGYSMWGTGPQNIFLVGEQGIHHFDGTTWQDVPTTAALKLVSVAGIADGTAFAVGLGGAIWRYQPAP